MLLLLLTCCYATNFLPAPLRPGFVRNPCGRPERETILTEEIDDLLKKAQKDALLQKIDGLLSDLSKDRFKRKHSGTPFDDKLKDIEARSENFVRNYGSLPENIAKQIEKRKTERRKCKCPNCKKYSEEIRKKKKRAESVKEKAELDQNVRDLVDEIENPNQKRKAAEYSYDQLRERFEKLKKFEENNFERFKPLRSG